MSGLKIEVTLPGHGLVGAVTTRIGLGTCVLIWAEWPGRLFLHRTSGSESPEPHDGGAGLLRHTGEA